MYTINMWCIIFLMLTNLANFLLIFLKTTFFVVLILGLLLCGSSPSYRTVWTWWWRRAGCATASTSSSTRYSQLRSASQKYTVNTFVGIGCTRKKKIRFEPKQTDDLFRLRFSLFRETKSKKFLFVSVQSKHLNSMCRYRSETTETNVFFWIVQKLVSVPVSVVSHRN